MTQPVDTVIVGSALGVGALLEAQFGQVFGSVIFAGVGAISGALIGGTLSHVRGLSLLYRSVSAILFALFSAWGVGELTHLSPYLVAVGLALIAVDPLHNLKLIGAMVNSGLSILDRARGVTKK